MYIYELVTYLLSGQEELGYNWFRQFLNIGPYRITGEKKRLEFLAIPLNIYASSLDRCFSDKTLGCEMSEEQTRENKERNNQSDAQTPAM